MNLFPSSVVSRTKVFSLNPSPNRVKPPPPLYQSQPSQKANSSKPGSSLHKPLPVKRPARISLPAFQPSPNRPAPYSPDLTPAPSPLRPHCLARDRLRLWKPSSSRHTRDSDGRLVGSLSEQDLSRIFEVTASSWADSTREAYGSGLLVYHIFCDSKAIPEDQPAPASPILITAFIASLAGSYSGNAISNYLYGVRAWHTLHGVKWQLNDTEIAAILKGADKLAPPLSKRKKRLPYTPHLICTIRSRLALDTPLDAAVFACLTTCFYAAARVGEFTVPRLDAFSPASHITPSNLRKDANRNGVEVTVLHIPRTKAAPIDGEDVYWARQHGLSDPYQALENHLLINNPPADHHLFAYRYKGSFKPLTKHSFIRRLAKAARDAGEDPLQGHGIRIGATLEYLLRGVPLEAMKVLGRWASDAFALYLRKHAQVMAPFVQANPQLHEDLSRLIVTAGVAQNRR